MRGKATRTGKRSKKIRITPAYAGKSLRQSFKESARRDHPRICGEKATRGCTISVGWGSPPHMRGKVGVSGTLIRFKGITPAYAGKSSSAKLRSSVARDHPRICGEKLFSRLLCGFLMGSPPHMRGKDRHRCGRQPCQGITPAYAGKRLVFQSAVNSCHGSPPHMRGKD